MRLLGLRFYQRWCVGSFRLNPTVLFGLCNRKWGIPQVLNCFNVMVWVKLQFVGVTMPSMGLHFAISCQNCPKSSLKIGISDELKIINLCQHFVTFFVTRVIGWLFNYSKSFVRSQLISLCSRWHRYLQPAHSCQMIASYAQKMPEMVTTWESMLFFVI